MQVCAPVFEVSLRLPVVSGYRCALRTQSKASVRVMASALRNESREERAARKEMVKKEKAEKRARREGHVPEDYGQKPCDLCHQLKDLLIRCQIDDTEVWHMVCGKCWKTVSGGVVDGDKEHPYYRYGGLWKNLHKADRRPDANTNEQQSVEPVRLEQLVANDVLNDTATDAS